MLFKYFNAPPQKGLVGFRRQSIFLNRFFSITVK